MKLTILLTLGYRRAYERAASWLRKTHWGSLFLGLPVESEPFVESYAEEKVDEKEFWSTITLLTGFAEPFINSLRLRFQPILDCIRDMYAGGRAIHCFQDLMSYVEERKISEKIFLLEFRHRATERLDLKAWKDTLLEEMATSGDSWRRASDRIIEEAEETAGNIILYGGYLESIEQLKRPNNEVEIMLLEEYWKSPLDILRTILSKHGFDNVPDREIERYLELHKRYLDLVIKSKNVDEAHEEWTQTVRKYAQMEHRTLAGAEAYRVLKNTSSIVIARNRAKRK